MRDLRERFEEKLNPPSGELGCREWNAATNDGGYGWFGMGGRKELAHRVAFFIANGYWPEICRHTCDNPPCCEPSHLLDGSHADNNRDMIERGRYRNGSPKTDTCINGHRKTEANGKRVCAECRKERLKAACRRKRGEVGPPNSERTHCIHGHPFDEANTYIDSRGWRGCRTRRTERQRRRRKEAAPST